LKKLTRLEMFKLIYISILISTSLFAKTVIDSKSLTEAKTEGFYYYDDPETNSTKKKSITLP